MTTINTPSIYINRAHSSCDDPDVFRNTFNRVLGIDCVRSVDIVKKTDNNQVPFIRAFVHFKFWPRNETADRMHYELMSDKRIEVTYDLDTTWFWRVCRSKLPARDDPNNATPCRNNRKPRYYGSKKTNEPMEEEDTSVCDVPTIPVVLQRTAATTGYKETSQRKVSNKPAWMSGDGGGHPNFRASSSVANFIPVTNYEMSESDDGESDDGESTG
jgi:hypothetical protein